jgi:hypothetical protein
LNHWAELNVFCLDGAVPIENNASTAARGSACEMPTAGLCRVRQSALRVCGGLLAIIVDLVGIIRGSPRRRARDPEDGTGQVQGQMALYERVLAP